jgi:elongation factor G
MARTADTALMSVVLTSKTRADRDELRGALRDVMAEDPALSARTDPATGETVISGIGELHLEIVLDRLKREFGVEASVGRPQIAYREAFTRAADGEMKYAKQSGGRGRYAHVKIHVSPGEPGSGFVFENAIVGGTIPDEFITPIERGIKDALTLGVQAGYPVEDVCIELYDGSYHDEDSSETAFRIAAALALRDAARKAAPVVLEPVMHVTVDVPKDYAAAVIANLSGRRGQIESLEDRGSTGVISARVPLSQMFGYACDLRSRTLGRATYSMEFDRYEPCRRPDTDSGDRDSFVGAPRRPAPPLRPSRIELPEPDDDAGGGLLER